MTEKYVYICCDNKLCKHRYKYMSHGEAEQLDEHKCEGVEE